MCSPDLPLPLEQMGALWLELSHRLPSPVRLIVLSKLAAATAPLPVLVQVPPHAAVPARRLGVTRVRLLVPNPALCRALRLVLDLAPALALVLAPNLVLPPAPLPVLVQVPPPVPPQAAVPARRLAVLRARHRVLLLALIQVRRLVPNPALCRALRLVLDLAPALALDRPVVGVGPPGFRSRWALARISPTRLPTTPPMGSA
jgi:hypothetical protein